MALLEIVILAVVQGIGEFLPVSSSGHVVVVATIFDQLGQPMEQKLTVNIVLHLGTLLAILVFYWRRVCRLLGEDRRVIGLLAVGTLPAVVVGLALKLRFEETLEDPLLAGFMFPLTGLLLLAVAWSTPGQLTCRELSFGRALWIGLFQSVAILPGISRSGATIVAGLFSGLRRREAAAFSFLLAIPAIGGAGILEMISLFGRPPSSGSLWTLTLGGGVSFVVGLAALWWLLRWLQQGRLHYFAWWVLVLGPIVIVWQLCCR